MAPAAPTATATPLPPAVQALATLQQLTLEAGLSESRRQLVFRILNRTVTYLRYDRAVLWRIDGRRLKLLGVSGNAVPAASAPFVDNWRRLIRALPDRAEPRILESPPDNSVANTWTDLERRTNGLSAAWLPIRTGQRVVAGLWLERWDAERFRTDDLQRLEPLMLGYGVAWRAVARQRGRIASWMASRRRLAALVIAAAVIAALVLVPVPLRIVAPCEVVPAEPLAIRAPLSGVIDEVRVLPGREVAAGDLLAVYDGRVAREELNVARQQVEIIASDLQRARVQAFDDPSARTEIALLENRLQQERIRLKMAQDHVARLDVRAPAAGAVMLDDPQGWRGRPVQVGERLMMLADPQHTKVRIWLPLTDNVSIDPNRPLHVILDADPRHKHPVALRYLANHTELRADGHPGFRAEAQWLPPLPEVKTGLQGTAVLYGERVSLGYWLLRRPLAALRGLCGI